ncbi:hypothetical protein BMS3Abin14_00696 [bacterium BMS3Abin14]|nr:hypothetical protein BMS3Abin14_00696 [bacterium BMS3Abin14]
MDIGVHMGGVQSNLAALLHIPGHGMPDKDVVDLLPCADRYGLDVLLKSGASKRLRRIQTGERSESQRIIKMIRQLIIGHSPVLLQYGATQNLLGGHPGATCICTIVTNKVTVDQIKNLRIVINDQGNGGQLLGNLVPRHRVKYTHLIQLFFTHFLPPATGFIQ